MQVTIRKFKPGDQDAVCELITGIMQQEFPQSAAAYPTADLDAIAKVYGNGDEGFFVAANQDHVIGTVAVKKEDNRIALLRRIFVAPDHRKRRVGDALIDYAINFCKQHGYQEIVFKTSSKMDGAIRLCQKKGFQQRAKLEAGGLELLKFVLCLDKTGSASSKH